MSLAPLYESALESLRELIEHNLDLNFGFDLPIDAASFISIPDPNAPGATLAANTKNAIILEIYEQQFAESRDANSITPLHKTLIKLQQDVAIYLLEVELFMRDLKLFPYKQYLPDAIRFLGAMSAAGANADTQLHALCEESFMSFMMSKLIGETELEVLKKVGASRLVSGAKRSIFGFHADTVAKQIREINQLLAASQPNYYKIAQFLAYR